ncbi:MAG: OmpA family protein [Bacteroidota bacterium]
MLLFIHVLVGLAQGEDMPDGQILKSIYFGGGSYYVDQLQLEELYQFIDSIEDIHQYHITIHSHTDNIGGAAYNAMLSRRRSEAVIQKLLDRSIPEELIQKKDFGQFNPIYDNSTWEGRFRNRRVDVIFWPMVM